MLSQIHNKSALAGGRLLEHGSTLLALLLAKMMLGGIGHD